MVLLAMVTPTQPSDMDTGFDIEQIGSRVMSKGLEKEEEKSVTNPIVLHKALCSFIKSCFDLLAVVGSLHIVCTYY